MGDRSVRDFMAAAMRPSKIIDGAVEAGLTATAPFIVSSVGHQSSVCVCLCDSSLRVISFGIQITEQATLALDVLGAESLAAQQTQAHSQARPHRVLMTYPSRFSTYTLSSKFVSLRDNGSANRPVSRSDCNEEFPTIILLKRGKFSRFDEAQESFSFL